MCIYGKEFVFRPISNQFKILVSSNSSFRKSLSTSYFEIDG